MNAFLWKKYKDISSSSFRMMIFFILPIVLFVVLKLKIENYNVILIFFPMATTIFSSMYYWDVEDIINSEMILSTNLNMKSFWKWNSLLITLMGYLYSTLILVIGTVVLKFVLKNDIILNQNTLYNYLIGIVFSFSMIALSSLQYLDFSKTKQFLSVPFSVTGTLSPILLFLYGNKLHIDSAFTQYSIAAAAVLFVLAVVISFKVSNEKLITNIQKLTEGYTNNIIND